MKERSRANPLRDWVRGEVSEAGPDKITVMVNRSLLGWHYGWVSSKHTCDAMHCFKVHLFVLDQPREELSYVGSVESPSFQLFSRRRQAMMMEAREAVKTEPKANSEKRDADRAALGSVILPPPKKRLNVDSAMQIRMQRNLCLDRLVRLMLVRGGSGTRSMYDTEIAGATLFHAENGIGGTKNSIKAESAGASANKKTGNKRGTNSNTKATGENEKSNPNIDNDSRSSLQQQQQQQQQQQRMVAPVPPRTVMIKQEEPPIKSEHLLAVGPSASSALATTTSVMSQEDPFGVEWSDLDFAPFESSSGSPFMGLGGDIRVGGNTMQEQEFDRLIEEALFDPQMMNEDDPQQETKARSRTESEPSSTIDFEENDASSSRARSQRNKSDNADDDASMTGSTPKPGVSGEDSSETTKKSGVPAELAQAEWDSGCTFTRKLEFIVRTHGSEATQQKADHIIDVLKKLPERMVAHSTNRPDFLAFFARWRSQEGIRLLREEFSRGENATANEEDNIMTSFVRDEDLTAQNSSSTISPMRSIYAEMRIIYRRVILDALTSLGGDPDDFEETMELCAKYGLLFVDPYYPPSKRVAAMTHLELYNSLDKFRDQDFGSCAGEFRNEEQRNAWVNAYWTVRKRSFRRHFVKAVLNEHVGSKLPVEGRTVPPEFDVSGTWVQTTTRDDAREAAAWGLRVGVGLGELSARLFENMWKRLTLRINTAGLHLQGERVLLANPAKLFLLDKVPRKYTVSNPLPMATFAVERTYVAWLGYEDSNAYLYLVFGGRTRNANFEEYSKQARFINDDEIRQEAEHVPRYTEMRITKRFRVAEDHETMTMDHKIHLFDDASAPHWEDTDTIASLFKPDQKSCVVSLCTKYIKVSDQGIEEVLELLGGN